MLDALPDNVQEAVDGYAAIPVEGGGVVRGEPSGDASAQTGGGADGEPSGNTFELYRMHAPGKPSLLLKCSRDAAALREERLRLEYLQKRIPVPALLRHGDGDNVSALLTTALPGVPACDRALAACLETVVPLLGRSLRDLHEADAADCPFDHCWLREVEQARGRGSSTLVRVATETGGTFELPRARALERLSPDPPEDEGRALTHGDARLDNFLVHGTDLCGFVSVGRAGTADPYRDLARAAWSLAYNWGARWIAPFFAAYGLGRADRARLERYRLLAALL